MHVSLFGIEDGQSTLIAESAQLSPHSSVSCLGRNCEVARERSPTVLEHVDHPARSIEASTFNVALIEPLEMFSHKTIEEWACMSNVPTSVDDLLAARTSVDELLAAPSRQERLCGSLPALSFCALTALDRTTSVGELFTQDAVEELMTARSAHFEFMFPFAELLNSNSDVELELPSLAVIAQFGATEVASPSAVTPRDTEQTEENIHYLAHSDATEMLQSGCGVLDSINRGTAVARAPSTSPPVCESASAIPKSVAPARAVPRTGLQERLQALAAAGLTVHVAAAAPHQDDGGSSSSSTTARSCREHAASRKGSVDDKGAGLCDAEVEAGDRKNPQVPKSGLWHKAFAAVRVAAGPSPSPPSVRQGFADPASTKISAEQLRKMCAEACSILQPDGGAAVDPQRKEMYLSDDAFQQIFGMSHGAFGKMAKWKQHALKKQHGLF